MIRVAVIDDHFVVRVGLRAILEKHPDLVFAGEADSGAGIVAFLAQTKPDVLLLDIRLPGADGIAALAAARAANPAQKVIMLTTSDADNDIYRSLSLGAKGYLLKDRDSKAIVEAVRNATESIHGKLSQAVMRKAANPEQHIQLILVNGVLGSGAQACQRLQELPGMGNVYLRSASYGNIVVDIDFYGTSTDLMAVLEGHGLHVLEAYSEYLKIG